jgi:hypothetical protein
MLKRLVRTLRRDHWNVFIVVQQPIADTYWNIFVYNSIQIGFLPFMQRSCSSRGFNNDRLADVINFCGVARVNVPVNLIRIGQPTVELMSQSPQQF